MSDAEDKPEQEQKAAKKGTNKTKAPPAVERTYEERAAAVSVIARPLAGKKSTKRLHKLVRKAAAAKLVRRGVKEVVKGLRKGESGLCILAGDVYPLDVISFLPVLLEEKNVPYLFVPSRQDLGAAACTKRPTSVVLVRTAGVGGGGGDKTTSKGPSSSSFDGQDLMDALTEEAKEYNPIDSAVVVVGAKG